MTDSFEPEVYAELEPEAEEVSDDSDSKPVSSHPNDWNISTLRDKYERKLIDLQPHYQREYVWELRPELPSRLIESLLLEIPIPPLYFMRLASGKIEVVDGQQRLTTLIRFVRNEFLLQKLQKLSSLNGKRFQDLSENEQEKIMDTTIRSIVIDAGTNYDLRYEVFERLNRGTMTLNEQEIRNCAYRGPFCDLLAELEQDANWRKVRGTADPERRFVEREMILRFFAFAYRIDHYTGNLRKSLNDYMGKYAPNDETKVAELGALFRQTMQNVYTAFGENAARIYVVDEGESFTSGRWEPKFSISALDIQAAALIGYSPKKIQAASKSISEAYKFYLITNPQIREAISKRPAAANATKTRWFGFKVVVQEIMNNLSSLGSINDPLFEAKALFRTEYSLAAGAISGVVLEGHLKKLCTSQNLPFSSRDGINKLNDMLKTAQVFDGTQAHRIQVLGDIRNRCDHYVPNPPTKEEVWELLDGTEKLIRNYPNR